MLDSSHPVVKAIRNIRGISILLEENPHIADPYNVRFLGPKQNIISIDDLLLVLNDYFKLKIDLDELEEILPELCRSFHMTYDGLVITLW